MTNLNPVEHRLQILKKLLADAEKKPKENKLYIEDLKVSIAACENAQPFKVIK